VHKILSGEALVLHVQTLPSIQVEMKVKVGLGIGYQRPVFCSQLSHAARPRLMGKTSTARSMSRPTHAAEQLAASAHEACSDERGMEAAYPGIAGYKGSKRRTGEAADEELVGLGEAQREGRLRVLAQTHLWSGEHCIVSHRPGLCPGY